MSRESNNDRILAEFPGLWRVLLASPWIQPNADQPEATHGTRIKLSVAHGDDELMWRKGRNSGWADSMPSLSPNPPHLVYKQGEVLIAMKGETVTGTFMWPATERGISSKVNLYVHEAFLYGPPPDYNFDEAWTNATVDVLVWVTVREYYQHGSNDVGQLAFGQRVSREVEITVYKPPTNGLGWEHLALNTSVGNTWLTGRRVMDGAIENIPAWQRVIQRLDELADQIRAEVWLADLAAIVQESGNRRSFAGEFGGIKLLIHGLAGRLSLQFERGDVFLHVMGADDQALSGAGVHALGGTLPMIEQLAADLLLAWKAASPAERRANFRVDDRAM